VRPTPAETVEGVVRILRETVAPAVTDPHARTQLQQVMVVLSQLDANDPVAGLSAVNAGRSGLLDRCRDWADADDDRSRHFSPIAATRPAGPRFEELQAADFTLRGQLETFLVELRAWRRVHGPTDSEVLFDQIGAHLAGEGGGTTPSPRAEEAKR
jgi:hypothetical protein